MIIVYCAAARTAALDKAFGADAALVRFVDDQFRNFCFRTTINKGGDIISLPAAEKLSSHPENYRFIGWNTKADGSGDAFEAGKPAKLKKGVNVFYAVWEQFAPEPTSTEEPTVPEKPEQPQTVYRIGVVDNDKKISASGARLALRAGVGLEKYSSDSPEFAAADIDRSGKIGADNARLILRAAVGLEDLSRFAKT